MDDVFSIRCSVEDLLTTFGRCADNGDGFGLAELFCMDGTLMLGDQEVRGRSAIASFTDKRCADPARRTRHTWTNLLIEHVGEQSYRATCIQQTFEQISPNPATVRVNDVEDLIEQETDGRLRLRSRRIVRQLSVGG